MVLPAEVGFGRIVAIKRVVSGSAEQAIILSAANQLIVTRAAIEHVVAMLICGKALVKARNKWGHPLADQQKWNLIAHTQLIPRVFHTMVFE